MVYSQFTDVTARHLFTIFKLKSKIKRQARKKVETENVSELVNGMNGDCMKCAKCEHNLLAPQIDQDRPIAGKLLEHVIGLVKSCDVPIL